jgi:exosortase/archaeosortase family protein
MSPRALKPFALGIAVIAAIPLGFVFLQEPVRRAETHLSVWLLNAAGAHGRVTVLYGTSIAVFPNHDLPFRAVVTPSCSSLASLLAVAALACIAPSYARARRLLALFVALATIALGNVLRIAGSIAVGVVAGRSSLVLFHDWVGSTFAFGYTLGGYVLMLYVLLPSRRFAAPEVTGAAAA